MKITLKTLDPAKIVEKDELPIMALSASCIGCEWWEGVVDDVEEIESAGYNIEGR